MNEPFLQLKLVGRRSAKRRRMPSTLWSDAFVAHVVIPMPDTLPGLLGVQTSAVSLLLPAQGAHIGQRRRAERSRIIAALPEALERIEYVGTQGAHKFIVVGRCRTGYLLFMALKFVSVDESQCDEAWISTAYFVGDASLSRKVCAEQLRQVPHRNV